MNVLPISARLLLALFLTSLAPGALALSADRDKPVNLEADTVTLDNLRQISVFEGNVVLSQGSLMIRADRMQITQKDGSLDTVVATGRPVAFRQRLEGQEGFIEGFADRVEYNSATSNVEFIGQARVRRGADELRGARISYNAATEFYKVVGQPDAQTPAGRVRAVIRPKPADQPAAGTP